MEKIIITRPLSKGEIIYSDLRTYIYGVAFLLCTLFFYMTWQSVDYNPTGWTTVLLITLCLLGVVFFRIGAYSFMLTSDVQHVMNMVWKDEAEKGFERFAQIQVSSLVSLPNLIAMYRQGKNFSSKSVPPINIRYHDRFRARAISLARRQPPEEQERCEQAVEKFFKDWENGMPYNQEITKTRVEQNDKEAGHDTSDSL